MPANEADRPGPERFGSAMREANVALKRPPAAAPKNQSGKDLPPRDLHAVRLGPKVRLITPKAAPPDQASLVDFARNQGMSQDMLALLRNAARPAASADGSAMNPDPNQPGPARDVGDGSSLITAGSDAALLDAMQAAASAATQTSAQALSALAAQDALAAHAAQLVAQSTAQAPTQSGTAFGASDPSSDAALGTANPGAASALNLQALFDRPLTLLPGNAGTNADISNGGNGGNHPATLPSAGTVPGTPTGQAADAVSQAAALLAAGLGADRKTGTDKPMGSHAISGNGLSGDGLGEAALQGQDANGEAGSTASPVGDDIMASVKLSIVGNDDEPGRPARFLAGQDVQTLNDRTSSDRVLNDRAASDRVANDRLGGAAGLNSTAQLSGNPAPNDASATLANAPGPSAPAASALHAPQTSAAAEARLDLGKQVPDSIESFHEAYLKGSEAYEELSEKLGKVLGERLSAQIARGEWSLRLQLSPAHLGAIDIRLQMRKGELNAVFGAAEAHTRDLLSDGMSQLRDSLAQSGLQLSQSDVQADARGSGNGQSAAAQSAAAQNASAQSGGNGSAGGQRAQPTQSSALRNDDSTVASQGMRQPKTGNGPDGAVDLFA